jgi:hypothetical protein
MELNPSCIPSLIVEFVFSFGTLYVYNEKFYIINFLLNLMKNFYKINAFLHLLTVDSATFTHAQRYWGSTVKMVFSYKIFTFHEANTCMALANARRRSVRALS